MSRSAAWIGVSAALLCGSPQAKAQALALPDPLLLPSNARVTTPEQWKSEQRGRLLDIFLEQIYGKPTVARPANMTFAVVETNPQAMGGDATLKRVEIRIQNDAKTASFAIRLVLFTPNAAAQTPVRTFVLINNREETNTDPTRVTKSEFWPAEAVIARGFGIAAFHISDLDPDTNSFANGVHQFYDGGVRAGPNTWGALSAWAWGASRVMDYFETDPRIDRRGIAVVGHSRGGKAALVAGATDERFALTISNDSGEGGAALSRRNMGESITDLNTVFPYWFATNYRKYNGAPETLPVDHHELLALMAPRAVYVASASMDAWADPEGEFLSAVNAAPVYGLFGLSALGSTKFPAPGEHIHGKQMGYHLRPGIHDLTRFDWDLFMDFFGTVSVPVVAAGDAGAIADDAGSDAASSDTAPPSPSEAGATPSDDAAIPPAGSGGSAGSAGTSNAASTPLAESGNGCSCRVMNVPGDMRSRFAALVPLGLAAARRAVRRRSRRRYFPQA